MALHTFAQCRFVAPKPTLDFGETDDAPIDASMRQSATQTERRTTK